ncbi:hypothetical protein DPMN_176246 [Dreissena polymorpha]|uniref:Cadherin domain-containing protein n=1 Tax=Dreissena polymorpha TaxID=45954 RepID=A0A9D4E8Q7_DREPO|nr:hypothetical protein DPMN_176246 [Dreissena polymorpha]
MINLPSQSGTALAVAGISATDPEGAAISYSIGCGSDSGYLTVDPTSGAVTMTAAFDLEVSAVNTHTLACTLTAADATGQSSGVPFNVIITDANDKLPVFNSASYPLYFTAGN